MSDLRLTSDSTSSSRLFLGRFVSQSPFQMLKIKRLLISITCLNFLTTMCLYSQNYSQARVACAEGLGQQVVIRARNQGLQRGLADLCVMALSSTASNGKLLDMYGGDARLLVKRFTDNAQLSTGPFHASGSPQEMWNKGELTPSLAFDAGFTRGYLENTKASAASMNPAELKRKTEECLNQTGSLAVCADVGRVQGALAYQTNNAFSDGGATPSPKPASQGPDRAQTAAAIDRKFQMWSQSWSWDRYIPGSVQIASIDCSEQCKASGQFSFNRMGAVHTIPFVAFLPSGGDGRYSLGRLCYKDDTANGMQECTD